MKILFDTHILLWAAGDPDRLPARARLVLEDAGIVPLFSPASIWEVAIKCGLERQDFMVDPRLLRRGLLDNGYEELAITSEQAAAVMDLPPLHKDPFDRMLIAQATVSGIELMTVDVVVGRYPGPIRLV